MTRKNYNLSDSSIQILHKVMGERSLKSETAAIEYVLYTYDRQQHQEVQFAQILEEQFRDAADALLASCRASEKNTVQVLDAVNTILLERGYRTYYGAKTAPSPVLMRSEEVWREHLAEEKLKKDFRQEKE